MLLIRLAALVQVSFLPGHLLLRATGLQSSRPLLAAVHAFAVSLVANYLIVFALAAAGLYLPVSLYVLFAVECAWFAWLHRRTRLSGAAVRDAAAHLRDATWTYGAAVLLAALTTLALAAVAAKNHDDVFIEWDAVVSWNRWAVDWASNALPTRTWRYPQLLPASWSMLYVFSRDQVVQAFARIMLGFFPVGIALVLLDVGVRQRSARFLLAIPVFALILTVLPSGSMSSGYADVPVAFFGCLAVLTAVYDDDPTERKWWFALFFACGAALTKQAGLFVLAFVWISALIAVRRPRFALRSAVLVLALVGSWYVLKEVQIRLGLDRSELSGVFVLAHQGRGVADRLARAARLATFGGSAAGIAAALVGIALIARALRDRRQRLIILAIVAPYATMWALLYSYDVRNAILIVPLAAVALMHGLPDRLEDLRPTVLQLVVAGFAFFGLAQVVLYRDDALKAQQLAQQRTIGDVKLNEALYRHFGANPILGKVATGYQYFGFLPDFHGRMFVKPAPFSLADLDVVERDPTIAYVMDPPDWMTKEAWLAIEERIREGRYRLLFDQPSMYGPVRLVEIRR